MWRGSIVPAVVADSRTSALLSPNALQKMDLRYLSSGALNREHYTLVQKVEDAKSLQEADASLFAQVDLVRKRLARRQSLSSVG